MKKIAFTLISFSFLFGYRPNKEDNRVDSGKLKFKVANAVRTDEPPKIDGDINDEVWSNALLVKDFLQNEPYNLEAPTIETEVRVLYDDDNLYIAYNNIDPNPDKIMAELFGKVTGTSKGKGGSMHMFDKQKNFFGGHGIVGNQIPIGAGIAFSEKYNKTGNVCLTYLGDGAVRIGAFHEAVNISMFLKLPVIFIIEKNGYAMGTSVDRTSNVTELYKMGLAYDIPSQPVDAMNVIKVHRAISKAANRARNGKGPSLLEFRTYRYKGHSMSDPAKYRTKEELESFKTKDPIQIAREEIIKKKIVSQKKLEIINKEVIEKIKEAADFALKSPFPNKEDLFTDVYI